MTKDDPTTVTARAAAALHRRLLPLLLATYALAAAWPGPGAWARGLSLGRFRVCGEPTELSLPLLLLGTLLFNAGLGVSPSRLRGLGRRPGALAAGLAANLVVPLAYSAGVARLLGPWHNPEEVQAILVGLALVAAMPVAGSSAAWAQNADGDVALSLGLVLGSTLLSPLTTPLVLHAAGWLAGGDAAPALHGLADRGTRGFLAAGVVGPSLLGLLARGLLGARRAEAARPALKLVNLAVLLGLNYTNAALSLPQALLRPDPDFLAAAAGAAVGLCALAFASGWLIARALRAGRERQASLMFGLGMSNNGTGLVLAATALADRPQVLLPLIAYNLAQHLMAGAADRATRRRGGGPDCVEGRGPVS